MRKNIVSSGIILTILNMVLFEKTTANVTIKAPLIISQETKQEIHLPETTTINTHKTLNNSNVTHGHTHKRKATTAERYGYGTLSIILISSCSLLGLFLLKLRHKKIYNNVITSALGLAAGALLGDAFLHLIPHSLGLHKHDENHKQHADSLHNDNKKFTIEDNVLKMLCTLGSILLFFQFEIVLQYIGKRIGEGRVDNISSENSGVDMKNKNEELEKELEKRKQSPAWMAIIGDSIHNFADGLAIGAAFSQNWQSGLSTSIAVFLHEFPHELGDVAIMIEAKWSLRKIILCQIFSTISAFAGLYISLAVSETNVAQKWIFAITVGMFCYLALANVLPQLLALMKKSKGIGVFLGNLGILIGYLIMFLIAIFEKRISF